MIARNKEEAQIDEKMEDMMDLYEQDTQPWLGTPGMMY
jgi:hypothetical protein